MSWAVAAALIFLAMCIEDGLGKVAKGMDRIADNIARATNAPRKF